MSPLFLKNPYLKSAPANAIELTDQGVILDRPLFYPTGGGQPGDVGVLDLPDGTRSPVVNTVKGDGTSVLILEEGAVVPAVGTEVEQHLNWDTRYAHMRMHTALHLLSVVIPLPVTGGQIGAQKGRLDFLMPEVPEDKAALEDQLNALIADDYTISEQWITDAELEAQPDLVKTMSVKPPKGAGKVRLVHIGNETTQIDLQPCGGTHVAKTAEIGRVRLGKFENKGKQNRRVHLHFA